MEIAIRYVSSLFVSMPGAGLFAGAVALCFGEKDLPGDDWMILASFIVSLTALTVWTGATVDSRQSLRRGLLAFAVAAVLLPVASVVFAITEPPSDNPIFPKEIIVVACVVAGLVLATIGWQLAKFVRQFDDE